MIIKCNKDNLINGLNIAQRATTSKSSNEIFECILIEATDKIILYASDNELAIKTEIDGEILNLGKFAINARLILDTIRKLPNELITITLKEKNIEITCKKSKITLFYINPDEFTFFNAFDKNNKKVFKQKHLKHLILKTIFSTSINENNKILTGELLTINNNKLKLTAMDGYRIALATVENNDNYEDVEIILPKKILYELSKLLSDDESKEIIMYNTYQQIIFEFEKTTIISRLISGEYFNINKLINNDYDIKIKVNNKEFQDAINRALIVTISTEQTPIILDITDNFTIYTNTTKGNVIEELDIIEKTGENIKIAFNPNYLLEALKVIDDEEITMYLTNENSPVFIKDDIESYFYIILPVKTR